MVRLYRRQQLDYPKLTRYLKHELPAISDNEKIWNAFKEYGEFNQHNALRVVNWEITSPMMLVTHLDNAYGAFRPASPNRIMISNLVADGFHDHSDGIYERLLLESTILHELVHLGDFVDRIDQQGEEGKRFEIAAYGYDVGSAHRASLSAESRFRSFRNVELDEANADRLRPLRNNNPGNIRYKAKKKGLMARRKMDAEQKLERDYCIFAAPEWGVRAIARKFQKRQRKKGPQSPDNLILAWKGKPKPELDRCARLASLRLRVDRDDKVDVNDPLIVRGLVEVVIAMECGTQPYDDTVIEDGLRLAGVEL